MSRIALLFALFVCSASTKTASAENERTLVIVPLFVGSASRAISLSDLARAVRSATQYRLGLLAMADEEIFAPDFLRAVADCGDDISCAAAELERAKIELGLVLTMNTMTRPPLITCELIDAKNRRSLGRDLFRSEPGALPHELEQRFGALLDAAGHIRGGLLRVAIEPLSARIRIDGRELTQVGAIELLLAPGAHRVGLDAPDHESESHDVELSAGAVVELRRVLKPNAAGIESWWLIPIGAAAVAASVAIVLVAGGSSAGCFCLAEDRALCPPCQ